MKNGVIVHSSLVACVSRHTATNSKSQSRVSLISRPSGPTYFTASPPPLQVSRLIHSRAGRYVSSHPVVALALLLFAALAMLPVGIFVAFALVTSVVSVAGFVAVEGERLTPCQLCRRPTAAINESLSCRSVFLLLAGGLSLLGVLCGIALFSVVASLVFNAAYVVIFNFFGYSHPTLEQVPWGRGGGVVNLQL